MLDNKLSVVRPFPKRPPTFETCLEFDGLSEFLYSYYTQFMGNDFTIEIWIKDFGNNTINQVSGENYLFNMFNTRFSINTNSRLRWTIRSTNGIFTRLDAVYTTWGINPSNWTHMVGRYTAATRTAELIVNNTPIVTTTLAVAHAVSNDFYPIGRITHTGTNTGYFKGKMDDLRVYFRKLNNDELTHSYNNGNGNLPLDMNGLAQWFTFENTFKNYGSLGSQFSAHGVNFASSPFILR